ncbi:MAG: translation initiation factor IF-2, partial [Flavobacteriaceae bacterium]
MAENANIRLNKVLRELNISLDRAVDYLASKGITIEARPTTKISDEVYHVLQDEFETDMSKKVASQEVGEEKRKEKEAIRIQLEQEQEDKRLEREKRAAASEKIIRAKGEITGPKKVGKIDLEAAKKPKPVIKAEEAPVKEKKEKKVKEPVAKVEKAVAPEIEKPQTPVAVNETEEQAPDTEKITTKYKKLSGPKIMGDKIDLTQFNKPKKKKEESKAGGEASDRKKRRKRIISSPGSSSGGDSSVRDRGGVQRKAIGQRFGAPKVEPTEEDVQKQVRETLEKLQGKSKKGKGAKYRRDKRDQHRQQTEKDLEQ